MKTSNKKLSHAEHRLLGFRVVKTEEEAKKLSAYLQAVEAGNADKVKKLLKEGADPNMRVFTTPMLVLAARKNRTEVIEALLKAGANPNIHRGWPLLLSVDRRNLKAVRALIAAGANVNLRGEGDTPALAMELEFCQRTTCLR